MSYARIITTLALVFAIGLGFGCTSKKSEEKKEAAQASSPTTQTEQKAQPAPTAAQSPSQQQGPEQPAQTAGEQAVPASELREKAAARCKQKFDILDANKDGLITSDEFRGDARIKIRDKNGDGALSVEELCSAGKRDKPVDRKDWLKPQTKVQ